MIWHERWRLGRAYEGELVYGIRDVTWSLWCNPKNNGLKLMNEYALFNMYYLDGWIVT